MSDLVLGIDIGTASTKAVLARVDGTIVATVQREHEVSRPRPGWVEHDVQAVWWGGLQFACDQLREHLNAGLAGICLSGIGPCVAICDTDLRPLRPAILYGVDTRAGAEVRELTEHYGADRILARGGSALSSQALGPKLAWLVRNEPANWSATAGWYMASSYLVARLTGEYILDHHSASQCDPLYDLSAGDWARDWAQEIAPGVKLPRLAWPGEQVGVVTAAAAEATGLPAGTPVMAGTIDAWAEAFSVGVRRPGDLMLMYGSTLFFVLVSESVEPDPTLWGTAGVEPGTRSIAAGMSTAGALTAWVRELTGAPHWEELAAEAAATPPGADGLIILPYFAGERTPIFDADARGTIAGLTLDHTRGHLARAAYEGIAYGVRHNLEAFAAAAAAPKRVVAVGGGTSAPVWLQAVSDIAGVDQQLPTTTVGAAYGDALLAAIGSGRAAPETDWTEIAATIAPRPETRAVYDEQYALYRELYPATRTISHRLAALQRV